MGSGGRSRRPLRPRARAWWWPISIAAAGERVADELVAAGGQALAVATDVADEAQVEQLVATVGEQLGQIDVLVNNAGVVAHKLLLEMDRADWDRQLAVQLTGPFLMSKHAARLMIDRGTAGKIINISSVAALMGRVKGGAHCASKAGLTLLTKVLAMELGQYGITVNAVAPGLIETQAQKEEMNLSSDYQNRYLQELPLGRVGPADRISRRWCCSWPRPMPIGSAGSCMWWMAG